MPDLLRYLISSRVMLLVGMTRYSPKVKPQATYDGKNINLQDLLVPSKNFSNNEEVKDESVDNKEVKTIEESIETSGVKTIGNVSLEDLGGEGNSIEMWKCLAGFVDRFNFCLQLLYIVTLLSWGDYTL